MDGETSGVFGPIAVGLAQSPGEHENQAGECGRQVTLIQFGASTCGPRARRQKIETGEPYGYRLGKKPPRFELPSVVKCPASRR
jgi:hypothetical protein